jgi:hypothetical protein
MATEQAPQNKETKTEKCNCVKKVVELEKAVEELKREMSLLRGVITSTR